jgi:hypothetical protein
LSPTRAGRVKPKTFKIDTDCSFAKSTAFRSENQSDMTLQTEVCVAVGVARIRSLTGKAVTAKFGLCTVLRPAQEFFTYMEMSWTAKFRPMLGAQGL